MSKWDEYVAGLKKLGLEELLTVANKGYDNYLKAVGKSRGYMPPVKIDNTGVYELLGITDEYNLPKP